RRVHEIDEYAPDSGGAYELGHACLGASLEGGCPVGVRYVPAHTASQGTGGIDGVRGGPAGLQSVVAILVPHRRQAITTLRAGLRIVEVGGQAAQRRAKCQPVHRVSTSVVFKGSGIRAESQDHTRGSRRTISATRAACCLN